MSVLVVFIAPCYASFATSIDQFVESYEHWTAGYRHDFLVVYKTDAKEFVLEKEFFFGGEILKDESRWQHMTGSTLLYRIPHKWVVHANTGYDIGSYLLVAKTEEYQKYDVLVFVGSTTLIQTENWLQKMIAPFFDQKFSNLGAVGTCGSYEGGPGGGFFPNVHLRTGPVWAIRPQTLNSLNFDPVTDKAGGWAFEHGPSSLTQRLHNHNLQIFVAGSSGAYYPPRVWFHKNGFCNGDGSEMIATDRHARMCQSPCVNRYGPFLNGAFDEEQIIDYV